MLEDPHLVEVTVANTGNRPLRREDFETTLDVSFGSEAQVLSVEVVATEPSTLDPKTEVINSTVLSINPLLLNPRDGFTFQALISDEPGDVVLTGRIAGVPEFRGSLATPRTRVAEVFRASVLGFSVEVADGERMFNVRVPGAGTSWSRKPRR